MQKPTRKMLYAVKSIAQFRGDYKLTFWTALSELTFAEASNYISKYGRKINVTKKA